MTNQGKVNDTALDGGDILYRPFGPEVTSSFAAAAIFKGL